MEPISVLVTAIVAGAAAGLKPAAENAIKDAYAAIKGFLMVRFRAVSLESIEKNPTSKSRREVLSEELTDVGAADDPELLALAKAVLDSVIAADPAVMRSVGVDLDDVTAASLMIDDIKSSDTGVKLRRTHVTGDITIQNVRSGQGSLRTDGPIT